MNRPWRSRRIRPAVRWERRPIGPLLLPWPVIPASPVPGLRRLGLFGIVTVLVGSLLGLRLVQLQVVDGATNRQAAATVNTRTLVIPAQRGRILAADGTVLVGNGATTTLTISRDTLTHDSDGGAAVLTRLAGALGRPAGTLIDRTKTCGTKGAPRSPICFAGEPYEAVPVAADVPIEQANAVLERPELYPGIAVEDAATRTYGSDGGSVAQLTGYLTRATGEDLTKARDAGVPMSPRQLVGRDGLEEQYDTALRGRSGAQVLGVGPDGLVRRQLNGTAPVPGQDIHTSIDPSVQRAATQALADGIKKAKGSSKRSVSGSVVVMDAESGRIAALTNAPSYDPSVWNGGISQADYDTLMGQSQGAALVDDATSTAGPPASTFKPFSLLAARATGVDPAGKFSCPSSVMVGNRAYRNYESAAHGTIDIPTALAVSCDTVFYRWAYRTWIDQGGTSAPSTTPDPYADVARSFGLGRPTGVDLPGEASGLIPDRRSKLAAWQRTKEASCKRARSGYPEVKDATKAAYLKSVAEENCRSGYTWRAGDAVNFAIGQGDVAVTPLQLATAYSALINGGTVYEPRVAQALARPGARPTSVPVPVRSRVDLDPTMLKVELDGLARVTKGDGTAAAAFEGFDLAGYPVSGKTGTGEVYGQQATAWFASFGPKTASGKRYVVVVRIQNAGEGGSVAAPVARQVWDVLRTRG